MTLQAEAKWNANIVLQFLASMHKDHLDTKKQTIKTFLLSNKYSFSVLFYIASYPNGYILISWNIIQSQTYILNTFLTSTGFAAYNLRSPFIFSSSLFCIFFLRQILFISVLFICAGCQMDDKPCTYSIINKHLKKYFGSRVAYACILLWLRFLSIFYIQNILPEKFIYGSQNIGALTT